MTDVEPNLDVVELVAHLEHGSTTEDHGLGAGPVAEVGERSESPLLVRMRSEHEGPRQLVARANS